MLEPTQQWNESHMSPQAKHVFNPGRETHFVDLSSLGIASFFFFYFFFLAIYFLKILLFLFYVSV